MKFSYLVVLFFIISVAFCCNSSEDMNFNAEYQIVKDTIIVFDPTDFTEQIKVITYKMSMNGKDTLERIVENSGTENVGFSVEKESPQQTDYEESVKIVKNLETGEIDTIITFKIKE